VTSPSTFYERVIGRYTFDGPSLASSDLSGFTAASDLMGPLPTTINGGAGNPAPSLELTFGDVGSDLAASLAGDDFYSFTLTPSQRLSRTHP